MIQANQRALGYADIVCNDFAFGDDFFGYTTKGTSHEKHKGKPKELEEYNLFILGFRHPPPVNQLEIHSLWTKTPR